MQDRKKYILVVLIATITVGSIAACATKPAPAKAIGYQCDRGTNLTVTFTEKGVTTMRGGRNSIPRYEIKNVAANITLADGTLITLPAQKIDSGFMYSNGKYSLRGNGDEAMWSVGRMLAESCQIES